MRRPPPNRIGAVLAACAVALSLPGAAAAPLFHAAAPPVGHTGGFGEPTCLACHTGDALNAFGGSVRIEGLPKRYSPGASYPLTVLLSAEETAIAGFELAARFAGGRSGATRRGASAPWMRGCH